MRPMNGPGEPITCCGGIHFIFLRIIKIVKVEAGLFFA
jgi:hypothetical protein